MKILVTGAAGFIGMNLCLKLLEEGHEVICLDSASRHPGKHPIFQARLDHLKSKPGFVLYDSDITNHTVIEFIFKEHKFDAVYNLAGEAGVRASTTFPRDFTHTNLTGFSAILEGCRNHDVEHLIFASSSSVYGDIKHPAREDDNTDHPKSYYAATKKSGEIMAASYSSLYGMKCSGVRLFTVYGPWGRPDMATWRFTESLLENKPLELFNSGRMTRDFTYIDDTVKCLLKFIEPLELRPHLAKLDKFQLYNIGPGHPIRVDAFLHHLEMIIGRPAKIISKPLDICEVNHTFADMSKFKSHYSFDTPKMNIHEGLTHFVDWYKDFKKYCTV